MANTGESSISDEAVCSKTGKNWGQWLTVLDSWGAQKRSHKEIARHLLDDHGLTGWWSQTVTVRYELERGMREVGQSARGWDASVQKTLSVAPEKLWKLLTNPKTRTCWTGEAATLNLREGAAFELDGGQGQLRAVRALELLRLKWDHPSGQSTLDITLASSAPNKTALRFRHYGLPTKEEKDEFGKVWKAALRRIEDEL